MSASRLISIAERIVKPNSPTPLSIGRYNLSGIDQLLPPVYIPIAAFYPFLSRKPEQISNLLQKSLSQVLSSYYPFAGRLRDHTFIDCNDMGAKFINVQYDCPMSEVVNLPDTGPKYLPFPNGVPWSRTVDEESLLVIQLSHFNCGGLAISANLSHKVADGCTLSSFISDWAAITRDHNTKTPSPIMIGSSFYPSSTDHINLNTMIYEIDNQSISRRRYVFPNSKLKLLKSLVESETGVQNLTRVEVLSALLYKCATTAATSNSISFKPSVLTQVINLRPLFNPPLPPRAVGNIVSVMTVVTTSENEMTIAKVVRELRKAKEELKKVDHVKENGLLRQGASLIAANSIDVYSSTSHCNFPYYNNLDFGWGKPKRVLIPGVGMANKFILMDNQSGDGIEARVPLPEKVVPQFENSKELLHFASPFPNI